MVVVGNERVFHSLGSGFGGNITLQFKPCHFWVETSKIKEIRHVLVIKWFTPR